ncbi:MAG: heme exporter protein CcmB [Fimbriimonadaceae bacterium]|nr:heme exporter protein CcmB [Chitinophagales bacterium]
MNLLSSTFSLIKKDILLEWRNKYAISGILMYMLSIILIIFFTFENVQGPVWVVLFWIIILFTAINAIAKSFLSESNGRNLYLYTLASPQSIILSKIIYNICIMLFLCLLAVLFYSFSAGFPVVDNTSFFLALTLGAISFASIFSMMSAIASKANNSGTLMAILSFPILIPILKILLRISLQAVTENNFSVNMQDILYLLALNVFIITLALILFPYLWRD